MNDFCSISGVSKRLNEPVYRLDYAIKTRNIEPAGRLGIVRLFGEQQIVEIQKALQGIRHYPQKRDLI